MLKQLEKIFYLSTDDFLEQLGWYYGKVDKLGLVPLYNLIQLPNDTKNVLYDLLQVVTQSSTFTMIMDDFNLYLTKYARDDDFYNELDRNIRLFSIAYLHALYLNYGFKVDNMGIEKLVKIKQNREAEKQWNI